MHRIDGPGATVDNHFTEGDPTNAVPATVVTDDWLNDVQENVCNVIETAGIPLVKGTANQLRLAIAQMISSSSLDLLNTTRIDVASAGTVNLTAAAPNTRHINITGTTAINGFTIAAGKCYFARFAGSVPLTNGTGLVTQTGGNIVAQAGDTCIIRATAANTVEILSYRRASDFKTACNTWVDFNGTGTVAIRDQYNVSSITDNGTGDYTVNLTTALDNLNYCPVGTAVISDAGGASGGRTLGIYNRTTSNFRVSSHTGAGSIQDAQWIDIAVFGGKN